MKTKALEDYFNNVIHINYDKDGNLIEDPGKVVNLHSRQRLKHRLYQLRELYNRIESGKANTPSELDTYAHAFLNLYFDVYGREYPNKEKLLKEIEEYKKWITIS